MTDGGARQVGFVGVGTMGNPMAANLLAAGHRLTVHDVRAESAANLLDAGAAWADSARAVADASDVTFLSLPNPADVTEVVTGAAGVLAGAAAGTTIVDLSTNAPEVVRALAASAAERGVGFLDAPVSGGVGGARKGSLAVMVGGDADAYAAQLPLLEVIGDRVFHVGDVGAGNVVKLLNNMLFFVGLLGTVE
ncbi:MAG TPA: NAD(P)-dependent oxidoreductase, partial [Acidimicrobiales bacterium]|nr:NAD(P)-dependent oxidoreductase [Acidimicrobiales bacterium]